MAIVIGEAAAAWLEAALGSAAAEGTAVGAATAAETAAATAAEAAAAAETAAATAAETATAAEEAAAAEAAAAEAAMAESEEGIEATVKAEEDAVKAAEKAAELEENLGARIGAEIGAKIGSGLQKALGLLKSLISKTGDILVLQMALDQIPTKYRKALAGLFMTLAAGATKLALVSFNFLGLSGSEEGKKIAKAAQGFVDDLHEKARKLAEDSPSKVPINNETHGPLMEDLKQHVASTKQDMQKLTGIFDELDNFTKGQVERKA